LDKDIDLEEVLKILSAIKAGDYTAAENTWENLSKNTPGIIEEFRTNKKWVNVRDAVESVFINKGAKAFKIGDYPTAEAAFLLVLALEPELSKVQSNLAYVYNRTGRYTEAERIFREILKVNPTDFDTQKWLARMLIKQQKWYEAEQFLQNMRKKDPKNRDILQLIDQVYLEKQNAGNYTSQGEVGQLLDKGQAEFKLGHYREAIHYYQEALQKAPDTSIIYTVIGTSNYFLGEYEQAEKSIQRALQLDSSSNEAKFILQKILENRSALQ
jgi:tetratricopeptide (TPR) repeat protein